MAIKKTIEQYEKEAIRHPNGCLIHPNKGRYQTTRHVYELRHGEIPKTLLVCHTCDTPACIEDNHHWLGTYKDNAQDASKKGRLRHTVTKETRAKISAALQGRIFTKEWRSAISKAKRGKKKPPLSEAHKAAISAAKRGKRLGPLSTSHRAAILEGFKIKKEFFELMLTTTKEKK